MLGIEIRLENHSSHDTVCIVYFWCLPANDNGHIEQRPSAPKHYSLMSNGYITKHLTFTAQHFDRNAQIDRWIDDRGVSTVPCSARALHEVRCAVDDSIVRIVKIFDRILKWTCSTALLYWLDCQSQQCATIDFALNVFISNSIDS